MLLTITTTHRPASDLGYLLHKHPDRCQSFDLSLGKAHVFYPEVGAEKCSACLLLDVDSIGMVRGKKASASFTLAQYVSRLGGGHRRKIRLRGAICERGAGRREAGSADADGSV